MTLATRVRVRAMWAPMATIWIWRRSRSALAPCAMSIVRVVGPDPDGSRCGKMEAGSRPQKRRRFDDQDEAHTHSQIQVQLRVARPCIASRSAPKPARPRFLWHLHWQRCT
eukprot:scaffold7296_cov100-Isochrysis_galbana.AAC.1